MTTNRFFHQFRTTLLVSSAGLLMTAVNAQPAASMPTDAAKPMPADIVKPMPRTGMGMKQGMDTAQGMDMKQGMGMKSGMDMKPMMMDMNDKMMAMKPSGNVDVDFAMMMRVHHQSAISMAEAELQNGKDPQMRVMAKDIIRAQKKEIAVFDKFLAKRGEPGMQMNK